MFGVLDPDETSGLPAREQTLPQLLKTAGYRSALIGKWHLGGKPGFLPNDRGFDYFYGLPWSNDMWPRPLMQNTDIIEQPADLDLLQVRSTGQALQFMRNPRPEPFFLFYATTAPHIPLNTSPRFRGTTGMGKYADVMAEFDWSVGELMRGVREMGQEQNTLFLLSSDNGPWFQGSAGRLRARKGESYEGGVRVPMIARMPGTIPAGTTVSGFASGLDLFPTIANWVGARPSAPVLDGVDIRPMLTGQSDSVERDVYLYFDFLNAQCARYGDWKVHFSRYNSRAFSPEPAFGRVNLPLPRPELYNLAVDPAEAYECSDANPNVVADIRKRVEEKLATMPDFVAATWRDTMALPVYDTAPGALPIQRRP